jgi:hypothetical protein
VFVDRTDRERAWPPADGRITPGDAWRCGQRPPTKWGSSFHSQAIRGVNRHVGRVTDCVSLVLQDDVGQTRRSGARCRRKSRHREIVRTPAAPQRKGSTIGLERPSGRTADLNSESGHVVLSVTPACHAGASCESVQPAWQPVWTASQRRRSRYTSASSRSALPPCPSMLLTVIRCCVFARPSGRSTQDGRGLRRTRVVER